MKQIIIIKIITVISFICLVGFIPKAHAKSDNYSVCYHRCLLDVPTVEECIINDDGFWNMGHDKKKFIRKECIEIVRDEKLDCRLNCYSQTLKPENARQLRAIEFWDQSVRSFPETNE
jgi:hypothetical protein